VALQRLGFHPPLASTCFTDHRPLATRPSLTPKSQMPPLPILTRLPARHLRCPKRPVGQVGGRCGADAGFGGGVGLLAAADALDPVG